MPDLEKSTANSCPATALLPDTVKAAQFGKPVIFGPAASGDNAADAAVIWLHGLGDTPTGWADALEPLRRVTPSSWRWLHLRSPKLEQPAYNNTKLQAWGPFFDTKCIKVGSKDHEDVDKDGFYAASVLAVHSEIAKLGRDYGVPASKVVIGGFSQGAALALESVLTYPEPLGGCVVLSGWMTPRARAALAARKLEGVPFLFCHGKKDTMVGVDCSEEGAKQVRELLGNERVQLELYEGLGHNSSSKETLAVGKFISKALAAPEGGDISIPEWEKANIITGSGGEDEGSTDDENSASVSFVSKAEFEIVKANLAKGVTVDEESLKKLFNWEDLPDSGVLLPIGIDALADIDPDDIPSAISKHGANTVGDIIVRAVEQTDGVLGGGELTVGRFKSQLDDEADIPSEFGEECSEEEDIDTDSEVDAEPDGDAPADKVTDGNSSAKRRKTSP